MHFECYALIDEISLAQGNFTGLLVIPMYLHAF